MKVLISYLHFIANIIIKRRNIIESFKELKKLKTSGEFDPDFYLSVNTDIAKNGRDPYCHYIAAGKYEGRIPREDYQDGLTYKEKYKYKRTINKSNAKKQTYAFKHIPIISILIYVDEKIKAEYIRNTVISCLKQFYLRLEICIAVSADTDSEVKTYLKSLRDKRIKYVHNTGGLAEAFRFSRGEYGLLMRTGDELTRNAAFFMLSEIDCSDYDFLYSDEDRVKDDEDYYDPHFNINLNKHRTNFEIRQ